MRFKHAYTSRENYYALGVEEESGTKYISIPLSLPRVDYEEYYTLTDSQYADFMANPADAVNFADECRDGLHFQALFYTPAEKRGTPWSRT